MSEVTKLRRRVEDAVEKWTAYIGSGRCTSHDEYVKSCATLHTYKSILIDIADAQKAELEGVEEFENEAA